MKLISLLDKLTPDKKGDALISLSGAGFNKLISDGFMNIEVKDVFTGKLIYDLVAKGYIKIEPDKIEKADVEVTVKEPNLVVEEVKKIAKKKKGKK